MIEYIKGELTDITPANAVIDCHGVGYDINISLIDYSELQGKREAKLYIHESIREDAHILYGFLTKSGREMFRLLIGVSGVGPNTARLILSAYNVEQLQQAIASGEDKMLRSVKGIGGKTAQRIIVDLKDKINVEGGSLNKNISAHNEAFEDALAALGMLGFPNPQSQKVLGKIFSANPSATTEDAIKQALQML